MTLDDYLSLLWRRKWIILQAVLVVPIVAVVIALRQDPVYQASSEVLLSRQDIGSQLLGLTNANLYTDPERFAETQAGLARVPDLAERVVKRAGVGESSGSLLGSSDVYANPNADLLVFTVRNRDPELAARLATAYGREFTRFRRELDTTALENARLEIRDRLTRLRAEGATREDREYANLLDKESELRTLENLQTSNTFLIRKAQGAAQIEPRPARNATVGIMAGIVLGICLAFLAEALDKRVRSSEEIEAALRLPLLARLPAPPRERRRDEELAMLADPSSPEAEAYRVLRTNLAFLNADADARVIMVTSSIAREGKSTTAASLAVAMARAGDRVALVDLDLHNPALHRFFDIGEVPGFTEAALGLAPLAEVVHHVPIPAASGTTAVGNGGGTARLDVLPSGTLPLNPGEFVESKAAERLLEELRPRYDYVLIDAPPLLPVSDAISLSARVDAMIILARLKLVERGGLREAARVLERCPALKLGVIITGAQALNAHYYRAYTSRSRRRSRRRELVG